MSSVIRIGSRESRLAVIQAEIVKELIQKNHPEIQVELVTMKTTGDKILDKSLELIGGKGLFVKELDKALLEGSIDISVHSLKDMPMEIPEELPIAAYSRRVDPRDALICRPGCSGGAACSLVNCIQDVLSAGSGEMSRPVSASWRKRAMTERSWQRLG